MRQKLDKFPKKALDYIACPICKADLKYMSQSLICKSCNTSYPIKKGVPILLHPEDQNEYFRDQTEIFDDYSRKPAVFKTWMDSYFERFFLNLKPRKADLILDIATGDGYITYELAKLGHSVIAFDLSMGMLLKLKKQIEDEKLEKNVIFVCGNATSLPFKNNIANIITANAILEHIPQERKAIDEINRISKPTARLMVAAPLAYKFLWPIFIPVNYIHDKRIGHLRRYTYTSFKKKFSKWKPLNVYYTGHFVKTALFLIAYVFKLSQLDGLAERSDNGKLGSVYGATNITVFFKKND